jgi:hypothetical protein
VAVASRPSWQDGVGPSRPRRAGVGALERPRVNANP